MESKDIGDRRAFGRSGFGCVDGVPPKHDTFGTNEPARSNDRSEDIGSGLRLVTWRHTGGLGHSRDSGGSRNAESPGDCRGFPFKPTEVDQKERWMRSVADQMSEVRRGATMALLFTKARCLA